jgi:hypothetical protein
MISRIPKSDEDKHEEEGEHNGTLLSTRLERQL